MRLDLVRLMWLCAALVLVIASSASAQVRRVHPDGDNSFSGTSWVDLGGGVGPWKTLRHALDELNAPNAGFDEIWIAMGDSGHFYTPHDSSSAESFRIEAAVTIRGGFEGGETSIGERDPDARSVLSGDLPGSTLWSLRIMRVASLSSSSAVLLDQLKFAGPGLDSEGNIEFVGGGLEVETDSSSQEGPVDLTRCDFVDCNAPTGNGGGAIYSQQRSVSIRHCRFAENRAVASLFGSGSGGAISLDFGELHGAWCIFEGNFAHNNGGAISAFGARASLANCVFAENAVKSIGSGSGGGGAIYHDPQEEKAPLFVANCRFDRNIASLTGGGGIFAARGGEVALSTFSMNVAASGGPGGAIAGGWSTETSASFNVTNSILWNNSGTVCGECPDWYSQIGPTSVDYEVDFDISYSCVEASTPVSGDGNINADPEFVDELGGDLRLRRFSLAINAGSEAIRPADAEDVNGVDGTSELHPMDLDDLERFTGPEVDMGAYEGAPCLADLTGDGIVNGADLAIVLGNWGTCSGCEADLTGDGTVNGADLAIVLGNWGDCPGGGESMMASGGGGSELTPEAVMEAYGLESIYELVEWLISFDQEDMESLLQGWFGS